MGYLNKIMDIFGRQARRTQDQAGLLFSIIMESGQWHRARHRTISSENMHFYYLRKEKMPPQDVQRVTDALKVMKVHTETKTTSLFSPPEAVISVNLSDVQAHENPEVLRALGRACELTTIRETGVWYMLDSTESSGRLYLRLAQMNYQDIDKVKQSLDSLQIPHERNTVVRSGKSEPPLSINAADAKADISVYNAILENIGRTRDIGIQSPHPSP